MIIHVLPINDLKEHEEKTTCLCNPKVEIVEGGMIVVHNSYDLREVIEKVEDVLNAGGKFLSA